MPRKKKLTPTKLEDPKPSVWTQQAATQGALAAGSLETPAAEHVPENQVYDLPGLVPADPRVETTDKATVYAAKVLANIVAEIAQRRAEALAVYEPLPEQLAFHKSQAPERLLIGSNRGGKTLPAAIEVAWAVTGSHPHANFPKTNGRCYCVGRDGRHLGAVMWRKLSRAGAFKIIRDETSGLWRAYRPWLPGDVARKHLAKPAPPLIPPRLIKSISWTIKSEGIPSQVCLRNGWELSFMSSNGNPAKGTDIDLAWFDEELENEEWYPETSARLIDRGGRFVWSATPQAGTEVLYGLHDRAYRQRDCERPSIAEFVVLLDKNPHLDEIQKRLMVEKCISDEDYRVRIGGEWAIHSYKIYPEYSPLVHSVDPFEIPESWTRYAAIDPGRQVCAVLFMAVPPPEERDHGGHRYLYDELYIKDSTAELFGRAMHAKIGSHAIRAFYIDGHMGRQTEMGSGKTVEEQFSDALRRHGVRSYDTGSSFLWGDDNVDAGLMAVRDWMRRSEGGKPKLLAFRNLDNWDKEMRFYHNQRVAGRIIDRPDKKSASHLMDCMRYLVMADPGYFQAPPKAKQNYVLRALRAKDERRRAKDGPQRMRFAPKTR